MRKKREIRVIENVLITDIAAEGKSIARVEDRVLFVPYVIPGDVVDVHILKKKERFMEGKAIKFHEYSELRQEPLCPHFTVCGGCQWQVLPYEEQLKFKQQQVIDQLQRIGKLDLPIETGGMKPILGSKKTREYRNKLEFTFSNKRWRTLEEMNSEEALQNNGVGFHIPGMFDKVLDVTKCILMDDIQNQIRNEIRSYAFEHNISFFDLRAQEGMLRTMMMRYMSTGELMVIVVFYYEEKETQDALLQHLADKFPQITSLLYVINSKRNDTITDQEILAFKGVAEIYEKMEDLTFKIGAKSFYQTNSEQAYELYSKVRELANIQEDEFVYDLYTGTGTIANFVAKRAKQVIGIEYVPEAIEDAKVNSKINNIDNTLFFAGDMKDILNQEFINQYGRPDVIITDPPRAGMHEDVINTILFANPERIVYVSCNPATQARDLQLLCANYTIEAVQPVDMFPHTHHLENIVLLIRK